MSGTQQSSGSLRAAAATDAEPDARAVAALSGVALVATVSLVAVVQAAAAALGWL